MWLNSKHYDFLMRQVEKAEKERDQFQAMLRGEVRVLQGRLDALDNRLLVVEAMPAPPVQAQEPMVQQSWFDDMQRQIDEMADDGNQS